MNPCAPDFRASNRVTGGGVEMAGTACAHESTGRSSGHDPERTESEQSQSTAPRESPAWTRSVGQQGRTRCHEAAPRGSRLVRYPDCRQPRGARAPTSNPKRHTDVLDPRDPRRPR
jgi:hypothetical protein